MSSSLKSSKIPADLVILHSNELVTLHSQFGCPRIGKAMSNLAIIKDGAVAVKGREIIAVGPTSEIIDRTTISSKTVQIDATNKLVTPGFIDPHVHLAFAGSRENELAMKLSGMTYLDILASGGGILKTVRETRAASIEQLVANGRKILNKMLQHGTTTIEAKSGYGLSTESEVKSLEAIQILKKEHLIDIIPTFLGAHAIPPEYKGKEEIFVELIINDMLPLVAKRKLAEFCDVFCEEGFFTVDQTKRILRAAEKYGLGKIIHVDEIVDTNGAALAAELKAIQAGHLLKANEAGLKEMAKAGVVATLLPGTPFCLMLKDYAPARKMIELGVPVAIATDLNPNCWLESMLMVITLSCYNMKLSPAEALTAATLNAACAIQRQNHIGSIEIGKKADIVVFDIPNHNFLSYQFGSNHVSKVIKNGKVVVENIS